MDKWLCQSDTLVSSSQPVPWMARCWDRLKWYLVNRGVVATGRKVLAIATRRIFDAQKSAGTVPSNRPRSHARALLNLRPGELVEVKSEEEILRNLDQNARMCGLLFMPAQRQYCGKRLKVYKRVRQIAIENGGGMRRLKGTVLLEGAICSGEAEACDRSCFFFWREAWLRRVEPDVSDSQRV